MPIAKVMASRFGGGGEPEEDMDGVLHLDASDPRVAVYQNLKERDVAGRGDLFILEGENSVHNLVQHGRMPLESVGVPVYALTHEDYSGLVGFNFHRGVLACGRKLPSVAPGELLGALPATGPSTVVLCERTNNLDNVGAVFRNGAAFGAGAVVFDGRSADHYRKSIRASGHVVCALVTPSTSAVDGSADDAAGAVPINEWRADDRPERVAVLMGAEGPGLTDEAQRLADVRLTIPMANAVDSVNVATACSIALHELASTPRRRDAQARRRAARRVLAAAFGAALALPRRGR
ncbi:glucosylceramidase [Aureococcus anophagefferens]|nr:glucosylceramidase [Aureococcus anophagefferens]